MKCTTFIIAACLAFMASQQTRADDMTTEFVTLSLGGGVPAYYYGDGEKVIKLEVSAQGIGAPVDYRGPAVLSLYDDPADLAPRDPDKPKPEPAFQVSLPAGEDRILLIFTTTQGARPGVRALGISTQKMKAGDYRIFNFSRKNVYVIMDDQKAVIQPGTPIDLSSTSWRSDITDLVVKFGLKEEENLRMVYSSVWGHMPARRCFLFIFDRPDKFNPFEIRRYHDAPSTRPKDAEE